MLNQLFLVIISAVVSGLLTAVIANLAVRKPLIDTFKESLKSAMTQHLEVSHQKAVEPHIADYIHRIVTNTVKQHARECRAQDASKSLAEVFQRLGKLEKVSVATYIRSGGKIEDLEGFM